MRLRTIQGIEIYEQLQHKGAISLRKDKRFCRKLGWFHYLILSLAIPEEGDAL